MRLAAGKALITAVWGFHRPQSASEQCRSSFRVLRWQVAAAALQAVCARQYRHRAAARNEQRKSVSEAKLSAKAFKCAVTEIALQVRSVMAVRGRRQPQP